MLSYQNKYGSWPKNINMEEHGYQGEKFTKNWGSSIDNNATTKQIRFLGRFLDARWGKNGRQGKNITRIKEAKRYLESFTRGLDYLFEAQYDNGGWPQRYPLVDDYGDYITFNDNAMTNVMNILRDISQRKGYGFVDEKRRQKAKLAYERGLKCMLKCQVQVNGKLTIWGAQHDPLTLEPREARSFEPPGLCARESGDIVLYLMGFEKPSREIIEAVEGAVAWFQEHKIEGKKCVVRDGTKKLVNDVEAEPMWARFYEIETMRPIFAGRDAVVKYDMSEIDNERIMGYAWYVTTPCNVLEEYPRWKQRISR
jgi:PelA/Pel-15E family pectate lyase